MTFSTFGACFLGAGLGLFAAGYAAPVLAAAATECGATTFCRVATAPLTTVGA